MASKKYLHGSRREHLINRRRFTAVNVLLAMVAVVAAYWVYQTAIAATTVQGQVRVNGIGRQNVRVACGSTPSGGGSAPEVKTDAYGYFRCSVGYKAGYHIRPNKTTLPSNITGGTQYRNPGVSGNTYEWQQANTACYNNTSDSSCNSDERRWDTDRDLDRSFVYVTPGTVRVSGKVTLNGAPRSGITVDCNHEIKKTDANGGFFCNPTYDEPYAVRVTTGLPSNASGGPTNNREAHKNATFYDWQWPAVNCFRNAACDHQSPLLQSWDRASDSNFDFAYTTPAVIPSVSLKINNVSSITVPPNSTVQLSWNGSGSPTPNCTAAGSWSGSKSVSGATNVNTGSSEGTRTYTLNCSNAAGSRSAVASAIVKNGAKPPPRPPVIPPPPGINPGSSDTTAPSVPGDFNAEAGSDVSNIRLTWSASKDSSGIRGYVIQRSLDKSKWSTIADRITGTSYTDARTEYKTSYFYRVKAVDNAGNSSGYATTDITTGEFTATESGTTISSEDGIAQVTLPDGALGEDASCSIINNEDNTNSLGGTDAELVYGPYELACKKENGDLITEFASPVTIKLLPGADTIKNYKNLLVFRLNGDTNEWEAAEVNVEDQDGQMVMSFESDKPLQFAVVGERKPGAPWGIISFIILLILAAIAVFIYLLRKAQKEHYQDYLRRKYYNL